MLDNGPPTFSSSIFSSERLCNFQVCTLCNFLHNLPQIICPHYITWYMCIVHALTWLEASLLPGLPEDVEVAFWTKSPCQESGNKPQTFLRKNMKALINSFRINISFRSLRKICEFWINPFISLAFIISRSPTMWYFGHLHSNLWRKGFTYLPFS